MGSSSEEEGDRFFDTQEEFSDSASDGSVDFRSSNGVVDGDSDSFGYGLWIKNPQSVNERRDKFLKWMNLDMDQNRITSEESESGDVCCDKIKIETDRATENSGAVLRNSVSEDRVSSIQCSMSFRSNGEELLEGGIRKDNLPCKIKNLDDGTEFVVDKLGGNGMHGKPREVGSNRVVSMEEFQRTIGLSPLVQQHLQREVEEVSNSVDMKKKVKRGWLRRLGAVACVQDRQGKLVPLMQQWGKTQRVRVHPYRKRSKELSSLYKGREFAAHRGPILTMKFSLDGHYLASGGKMALINLLMWIRRKGKKKRLKRSSDSTCVIIPPKVFRILEEPLHEFQGHSGDILDLSWSKKGYLLSSSTDKTVRLWQVGQEQCLRVFYHNDYVTCVDFNPVDDNYFISGSIDGKVRIWEVHRHKVVDWIDIRDIVTAVCYRPDGKGGIVGSMVGNCCFYDIIDNHLQVDAQIYLQGKKKLPGKRITGFQFSPSDPTKVMVASADSLVRILCGADVICKFRGVRNVGSHTSTSFTADGKHIVSASEDSNVHLWDYNNQDRASSRAKDIWSCESFLSHNATIAIPWCGMKTTTETCPSPTLTTSLPGFENGQEMASSPDCFSAAREFLLESLPRGSATWPEEKLPDSSPLAVSPSMRRSEYKFLKSACQNTASSPHTWGLVIVTAGWDGWIRTYHNYGLPHRL
ncbi:hypothetical protein AAG906_033559 [Vitis piasezkii]